MVAGGLELYGVIHKEQKIETPKTVTKQVVEAPKKSPATPPLDRTIVKPSALERVQDDNLRDKPKQKVAEVPKTTDSPNRPHSDLFEGEWKDFGLCYDKFH